MEPIATVTARDPPFSVGNAESTAAAASSTDAAKPAAALQSDRSSAVGSRALTFADSVRATSDPSLSTMIRRIRPARPRPAERWLAACERTRPTINDALSRGSSIASHCERLQFPWSPQHLVDFARVLAFGRDHSPRVFLQHDVPAFHEVEQRLVVAERLFFVLQRLPQDRADVVLLAFEKLADAERGMATERGDVLPRLLGVGQRLLRLAAKPVDDGNAVEAIDHERIVRVVHDPREFGLENPVEHVEHGGLVDVVRMHESLL